jgi:hypothetical protein
MIDYGDGPFRTTAVLFISKVDELTARAVALGSSLATDHFEAVAVPRDERVRRQLHQAWAELGTKIPLVLLKDDSGRFVGSAARYARSLQSTQRGSVVVIVPRHLVRNRWENLLRNHRSLRLKAALRRLPCVMTMDATVPTGTTD